MKIMQKIKVHGRACQHCDIVCLILIAIFAVFSQILKFRLDFIPVSVVVHYMVY